MRKTFKKLGLSLATLVCAICAGVGVSLGYSKEATKADAAESATTVTISGADYYISGAGIRLVNDANGAGIRFHTRLTDAEYAKLTGAYKTGTLIIPEIRYDGDLTLEDMEKELKYRPVQIETTDIWYDSAADGFMQSTAYLYDIPEMAYGARYVARSYIQYADGKVAYSAVGESSLTDIATKMPETDERKPKVQPYIVENVDITIAMPDGNVKHTIPYGATLGEVSLEYNSDLYVLTGLQDQFGRNIENIADYEATIPVTITPTFETKAMKNAVLAQFLNDCYGATAVNRAFQNGSTATSVAVDENTPEGFESVLRLDWYSGSTEIWKVNGNPLYRGCFNNSLDISKYKALRFAMKMETEGDARFVGHNNASAEADWVVFPNNKWVTVQLEQTSANVWDMTVTGEDGAVLYAVEGVSRTSGTTDTIQSMVFGSSWTEALGHTHVLQFMAPTSADYDISIYQTEVIGERNDHLPPIEADTIAEHIWRADYFEGGSSAHGKWSTEAAPIGFSKVTEYYFPNNDFPTGELYNSDISAYSDVYFAMKSNKIYLQGCTSVGGTYSGGEWLYVHMYQNEDGTWNKDFVSADLTAMSLGEQANIANAAFNTLISYLSGGKRGSYPNGGDGTIPAYFTELKGILKDGSSSNTGSTQASDPTDIPTKAEAIRNYLWRDDKYALTAGASVTEAAPAGYSLVQEFKWGPHGSWNQNTNGMSTFCIDTTADISIYSDIYWAIKAVNASYININNSSNGHYYGSDWLYLHFSKQADGKWSYSVKSLDGFTANGTSTVSAANLQAFVNVIYPYRADVSMEANVYFTEPLGVLASAKETWGDRVIWSAIEDWAPADKKLALPEGFTSLYKKDNYSKATDFALLDLSNSLYQEIRFGIIGLADLGIADAYRYVKDGTAVSTVIAGDIYDRMRLNLITLTKNGDGTWGVVIDGYMWASGVGFFTSHTVESVPGDSLYTIMNNLLGWTSSKTVYVTEVRGLHTCEFEYASLGNGYLQLTCACGETSGEPIPFDEDIVPDDATKVRDSIWRANNYALSASTDMEVPYGFTNVKEYKWNLNTTLSNGVPWGSTNKDMSLTCLDEAVVSDYTNVYFAMKNVGGTGFYVQGGKSYTGSDWLYFDYHRASSSDTWSLTLRSPDGYEAIDVHTGLTGTTLQKLMAWAGAGVTTGKGCYPTKAEGDTTSDVRIYMTDMWATNACTNHTAASYVSNNDGTHNVLCDCGYVIETVDCGNATLGENYAISCGECGGAYATATKFADSSLQLGSWGHIGVSTGANTENAPAGFSTVTHYVPMASANAAAWSEKAHLYRNNYLNKDMSVYSEVWYAIKTDVELIFYKDGNAVETVTDEWVTFHLTRTGDVYWTMEAFNEAGEKLISWTEQGGDSWTDNANKNTIARLMYVGTTDADGGAVSLYYNPEEGNGNVYTTEVIGLFNHGISKHATKVRDSIWRANNYALSASTTEPVPAGFTNVKEYKWNLNTTISNDIPWGSNNKDMPLTCLDEADVSAYVDVYFAMKNVGGTGFYVQGGTSYTGTDWLYYHYHRESTNDTWSLTLRSPDGYEAVNVHTGLTGTNLQKLMSWTGTGVTTGKGCYPTKTDGDTTTDVRIYMTDMWAVAGDVTHTVNKTVSNGDGTHTTICVCGEVINSAVACTHSKYVSNGNGTHSSICGECGGVFATTACTGIEVCGATGTCNVCQGEYTSNVAHEGGTATCTQKATCINCGQQYGDFAECDEANAIWDGNTYKCNLCGETFGTVVQMPTETTDVALYTNATYAGKGASGDAFDASVARSVAIDLSAVTKLEITGITNVELNGAPYTVVGLADNKVTIDGVVPYDVFGEYTLTAQITVKGAKFDIQMPILVITDLVTTADGLLNVRQVLRGKDATITYDTANPVTNLVIGGKGGLGTMHGRGYYKLGNNLDLANYSINGVNRSTTNSYNRVYVFGTTDVPFAGTFDGAGNVLSNLTANPGFWNNNASTGFTQLYQDSQGATGASHAGELESSLFGMVNGTIKNLAITNAVFGASGNIVNGGTGVMENVYVQISDLQAAAAVYVAPIAQRASGNNMTLTNVVVDLTKHDSAILNGTSATKVSTHYPSVIGQGAANIENVGVYGFDSAWVDSTAARGNVYVGNTDGSAVGIYTTGITMTNSKANFWQISLDPTIWKIVDGVPMLINVSASGTATDSKDWTGEAGGSYNIAWGDDVAGSYEAVTEIRNVTTEVATQTLGVTADSNADIIVGAYDKYAEAAGVDVNTLATDGRVNYGVYKNGSKVYVLADGEEGFTFAADMLLRQLYGYNQLAKDDYVFTSNTLSLDSVTSTTAQIAFNNRTPANGYSKGDMNFNGGATYTAYNEMHNALDYLYATDGSGNVTGSEIVAVTGKNDANEDVTYTTTSYWLSSDCDDVRDGESVSANKSGEQLCYLAHGDKTAFNALVNHVVNRIIEVAQAKPGMTAINFMIEDDPEYCMCSTCKPFYNASIPQLIFLNTVAEKLESNEYLINNCRTIDIVFFAYSSYAHAPIIVDSNNATGTSSLATLKTNLSLSDTATATATFNYADMNKAGATYAAATDTTSRTILKAHKNLRLQWTSHKAFHSYALNHEANSTMYLALMGWLASVDASKVEVFMYQTTFRDYFLPLNTWEYQVDWYKNLNAMGINSYIFNLGDTGSNTTGNPYDSQTGFAAFKAYIDSRAMTDSSASYEQLKSEFFGTNGYYGEAGPTMLEFFNELETVMNAKKQTGDYVDYGNFAYADYSENYPHYHYYTDGTSEQAVKTSQADRVQAWFNGAYGLSQNGILFGDIADGALNVNTGKGNYSNPAGTYTLNLPTARTDVYVHSDYNSSQLETLKAWYQYCVTAKGMVAEDSVYAKRIQVESWFPEYALRLFHSTYAISFTITREGSVLSYTYPVSISGITSTLSADTGLTRTATEFYQELIAGGMRMPSEQYTFDTTETLSLGWTTLTRSNGDTINSLACTISASAFVNWGVTF